jgi:hypothetical protein
MTSAKNELVGIDSDQRDIRALTDRPYLPAIESLKLCQAALERILPPEERRIILGMHKVAVLRLEQLARSDDARVARINRFNQEKRLTPEQTHAERAHVRELCERYRANIRGRFSREGATRFICAASKIPRKRVAQYLKAMPLDRGDAPFGDD